jgi:hypothetical protein
MSINDYPSLLMKYEALGNESEELFALALHQ